MIRKILTFLKWCVGIFLCLGFIVFTVNNRDHMVINLFPLPFVMEFPKFLFAIVFFSLGIVVAAFIKTTQSLNLKRQLKEQSTRITALENELTGIKVDHSMQQQDSKPLPPPMKDAA